MRKEVVLAIIIGIILGGIVLYGIKIANQSATQGPTSGTEASNTNNPTPTPTPVNTISIISPTDHAVLFSPTVTLKGKTQPNISVAITTDSGDTIINSDDQGNFSTDATLIGGENNISAVAVFPDESTASASISIIYTTSQIDN